MFFLLSVHTCTEATTVLLDQRGTPCICIVQYTVKKVSDFPVPSRDGNGKIANLFAV
jgi:hypothetical protein